MGILSDLLTKEFGCVTTPVENELLTQVGVADAQLTLNKPDRVAFIVINLSANIIYIRPNQVASAAAGIAIAANGGWRSFRWDEDFELVSAAWHAIASGAASAIYTLEMVGRH